MSNRYTKKRNKKVSDSLKKYYKENKNPKCGFQKGAPNPNKGKKLNEFISEESNERRKENIRENARINPNFGTKGMHWKLSEVSRKNISDGHKGEKCYRYIDGRSYNKSPYRYGDDWFKIRLLIYARDNFTCQECELKMSKETGPFDVHHIVPFLISRDNSLNNLITLCRKCHMKIESNLIKQQQEVKIN